jgi:hypothetical protein
MDERKILTPEQLAIQQEICQTHDLDADQISFEGTDPAPIFNYEAICLLSLKLTDIQDIDCFVTERDPTEKRVTVKCRITLPDARTRGVEASAELSEPLPDGENDRHDVACGSSCPVACGASRDPQRRRQSLQGT